MARRRTRAAQLYRQGKTQAEVARELEVSRQSVSRWYADWKSGGVQALRGTGRAGRLPLLDETDLTRVARPRTNGPLANGYATDMWTLVRVGQVIEAETGVVYHQAHVAHPAPDGLEPPGPGPPGSSVREGYLGSHKRGSFTVVGLRSRQLGKPDRNAVGALVSRGP